MRPPSPNRWRPLWLPRASRLGCGAAVYAARHFGFFARLKPRLPDHPSRFLNVAAGAKADGTQGIV